MESQRKKRHWVWGLLFFFYTHLNVVAFKTGSKIIIYNQKTYLSKPNQGHHYFSYVTSLSKKRHKKVDKNAFRINSYK